MIAVVTEQCVIVKGFTPWGTPCVWRIVNGVIADSSYDGETHTDVDIDRTTSEGDDDGMSILRRASG